MTHAVTGAATDEWAQAEVAAAACEALVRGAVLTVARLTLERADAASATHPTAEASLLERILDPDEAHPTLAHADEALRAEAAQLASGLMDDAAAATAEAARLHALIQRIEAARQRLDLLRARLADPGAFAATADSAGRALLTLRAAEQVERARAAGLEATLERLAVAGLGGMPGPLAR